ncbi:unnamed protein product [Moneuplotes crassus]|uniref:Uncharacterized protein n=1 Tax=Euplotes crassus TaxID=5936 RepID=A0AAD2D748_EUPCR|nr:unnamed protein product [Moneuplotes crassus]
MTEYPDIPTEPNQALLCINFLLIIAMVGNFVYMLKTLPLIETLLPAHLVIILPSVLYHLFPDLRSNIWYSLVSHLLCIMTLLIVAAGIAFYIWFDDGQLRKVVKYFGLQIFLPASVMAISLLLLMDYGHSPVLYSVPTLDKNGEVIGFVSNQFIQKAGENTIYSFQGNLSSPSFQQI